MIRIGLDSIQRLEFCTSSVFSGSRSWDLQVLFFLLKTTLKLGPMILFTHLKIILLQCFQFSIFSNKKYPNTLLELPLGLYCFVRKFHETNFILIGIYSTPPILCWYGTNFILGKSFSFGWKIG